MQGTFCSSPVVVRRGGSPILSENVRCVPAALRAQRLTGKRKLSTSTVAALFSKMALTGQSIAMVDMVFLVFTAFPYLP